MIDMNFPPPPPPKKRAGLVAMDASGDKEPWHKPSLHVLNELVQTSGSPTLKGHPNTDTQEDETNPFGKNYRQKNYRPISVP